MYWSLMKVRPRSDFVSLVMFLRLDLMNWISRFLLRLRLGCICLSWFCLLNTCCPGLSLVKISGVIRVLLMAVCSMLLYNSLVKSLLKNGKQQYHNQTIIPKEIARDEIARISKFAVKHANLLDLLIDKQFNHEENIWISQLTKW